MGAQQHLFIYLIFVFFVCFCFLFPFRLLCGAFISFAFVHVCLVLCNVWWRLIFKLRKTSYNNTMWMSIIIISNDGYVYNITSTLHSNFAFCFSHIVRCMVYKCVHTISRIIRHWQFVVYTKYTSAIISRTMFGIKPIHHRTTTTTTTGKLWSSSKKCHPN